MRVAMRSPETAESRIYDIRLDEFRPITMADIEYYGWITAGFGELVTHLRKTGDPAPADLAVLISQGKIDPTEGAARFRKLREDRERGTA